MAKFNMMELLNNNSKENINVENKSKKKFKTVPININELKPSDENFYSTENVVELKNSIELLGLQQNLVVKKTNDGYEIIAGHRRYKALKMLFEEGKKDFEYVPCKVESEKDALKDKLLLIITNSTARELTDYEKTVQAEKLKELLTEYKKQEKIPGRVREIVADILNTSSSQIARMEGITNNLIPEFKEEFKEAKVNISAAHELSTLLEETQQVVFEEFKDKGQLSIKDVRAKKEELKRESVRSNDKHIEKSKEEVVNLPRFKTNFEIVKDLTIDELAIFICSRCSGGNGYAGFCDLAIECKGNNKYEICKKWLRTQAQNN
ncbi:ParB/RepB/Spo0J family partition protein [Clostridium botulinum]|nr:ParB protein [Clostridium botulinum]MBY6778071.1 ParB/RepB/Spo0J family partition protein [Clostridium botulinum]MBY6850941.1 ParB/RepB/Spo0J family partition protein [Clostridium botulinum]NFF25122.1 ParB/RepB/Spo0J family partition protein [Clostridium botulinum]NFI50061.1 ParB/RepB/Spo0J family partition protein [Clostridium botulinum]